MSFDNTYNTNRFKLPLFQVTGQTCLKSVYNAAFGLIDNERREGFQFLAEAVRDLTERHGIPLPDVVITDYDEAMKAALDSQYPDSQQQLCIHHINANVLLNAKRKWNNAKEGGESDGDGSSCSEHTQVSLSARDMEAVLAAERPEGFPSQSDLAAPVPHNYRGVLELWKFVVFAETKEEHEKAWVRLCDEFNDQQAILMYLYKVYLPNRAQWAQCFIKKYRNFGIRVTSGTEASNNNVKSYLLNGMSHLYSLVEAIEAMLNDQERDFIDNCSQDEVLTSRTYSGPGSEYLGELRSVMSEPGLKLNAQQLMAHEDIMAPITTEPMTTLAPLQYESKHEFAHVLYQRSPPSAALGPGHDVPRMIESDVEEARDILHHAGSRTLTKSKAKVVFYRTGHRDVSSLAPEQLKRRRAKDQRKYRLKIKETINSLKKEVQDLEKLRIDDNETILRLRQETQDLRIELISLLVAKGIPYSSSASMRAATGTAGTESPAPADAGGIRTAVARLSI
ncbi:hypothetical protein O9K51_10535 [Purpureocillium lavendulum]|uniref:MULE transposase domain-containing protein n=1 Tax=Purpureocillium lavendulum TaxID=1247861 RepID=A0AB34FD88_9HYPO|nr:hypothetical protein O9K51_10535 [Purpureocillium lavendulum]